MKKEDFVPGISFKGHDDRFYHEVFHFGAHNIVKIQYEPKGKKYFFGLIFEIGEDDFELIMVVLGKPFRNRIPYQSLNLIEKVDTVKKNK